MDFTLDLKTIVAIIAVITTIIVAYLTNWWRNRKSLSYEVTSDNPILTSAEEIGDELQLLHKGMSIKGARLAVLRIVNDGNQPVTSKDFEKPLTFIFASDSEILSVEKLTSNPDNLNISPTFKKNKLFTKPALFNKGDFVSIKMLVNTVKIQIKPEARIIGVKNVDYLNSKINLSDLTSVVISLFFFLLGLVSVIVLTQKTKINPSEEVLYAISICVIIFGLIIAVIDITRAISKRRENPYKYTD